MKKRIISFSLALSFFFSFLLNFRIDFVSALSPFPIPTQRVVGGNKITDDIIDTFISTLENNYNFISSGFDTSKTIAFLYFDNNNNLLAYVTDDSGIYRYADAFDNTYSCYFSRPFLKCEVNSTTGYCNTCSSNRNDGFFCYTLCYVDNRYSFGALREHGNGAANPDFDNSGNGYSDWAIFPLESSYNPIIYPIYEAVYSLKIDKSEFIKWLIDTGKYIDIASGLAENRVDNFVDIFQRYGSNSKAFNVNVKEFFEFIGISQTISDYNVVYSKTHSLYKEYQQYVRQQLIGHYNDRTQNTSDIKPDTNSNNTTLITNSDDDTIVIRILRDILRSLIALPNNLANLIQSFEISVDGLENTVNVVNQSGIPNLSSLWTYNESDFDIDLVNFVDAVSNVQQLPVSYLANINNNALMPEKMLSDNDNLIVNIPNISGFTVSNDGKSFSTQTTSYAVSSNDYPWLDPLVKKIKRFSGILLILGYLVHLRYKLPDIVRGE